MICLLVCLFFMLKLLQYCNYIIAVMQIKLMLLLLIDCAVEEGMTRRDDFACMLKIAN